MSRIGAFLIVLAMMAMLAGCMTANQLEAERAYYQAMVQVAAGQKPLVDLKIADPSKPINVERIVVHAPSSQEALRQYVHQASWGEKLVNRVLDIGAPLALGLFPYLTAKEGFTALRDVSVSAMARPMNAYTYSQTISGEGNAGQIRAMGDVSFGNVRGDRNTLGGMIDQTSVPTVVEQPPPVIVPPSYPPEAPPKPIEPVAP